VRRRWQAACLKLNRLLDGQLPSHHATARGAAERELS
jgi:hypothetical protein